MQPSSSIAKSVKCAYNAFSKSSFSKESGMKMKKQLFLQLKSLGSQVLKNVKRAANMTEQEWDRANNIRCIRLLLFTEPMLVEPEFLQSNVIRRFNEVAPPGERLPFGLCDKDLRRLIHEKAKKYHAEKEDALLEYLAGSFASEERPNLKGDRP